MKTVIIIIVMLLGFQSLYDADNITLATSDNEFSVMPIEKEASAITKQIELVESDNPWDNTVGLAFSTKILNYCYYLPENVGINMCFWNYIVENVENMKPKYMLTEYDKEAIKMYLSYDWRIIAQGKDFVLYQTR